MRTFPRWLFFVSAAAAVTLLCGGAWFYFAHERHMRQEVEAALDAIARLKVDQLSQWRAERLADAAVAMKSPFLSRAVNQWMADRDAAAGEEILMRLRATQEQYHYSEVIVVDPGGNVRMSLTGQSGALHGVALEGLGTAFRERRPVIIDLHLDPGDPVPHVGVVAPFFAEGGKSPEPIGALILRVDAKHFLYPMIQAWPTPSRSAETLLVRRDGDAALFLNDLRHQQDTALKFRIPLSHTDLPAVMTVLGKEGVFRGKDYRGVEVFSALKAVPDSPWFLVAKVDAAEALADWRFRSVLMASLVLAIGAFLVTAVGIIWQRNAKDHYRSLFQAEAARRQSEERYRTTLMRVGDAVIATDAEGRVELTNQVAEALTGWKEEEVRGKLLEEVFHIVNEETRSPVENPVRRVMQRGLVVGLGNHTVLIARDGTERPIADSGAPILDENGAITGVVLVFRDQTQERMAQQALEDSEQRFRALFERAGEPIMIIGFESDNMGRILAANPVASEMHGYTQDELLTMNIAHLDTERSPEKWADRHTRLMRGGALREEATHRKKDGTLFPVEINAVSMELQGRKCVLSIDRDISDRKRAEDVIRVRMALLEFAATHSLEELLRKTLDEVGELTGSPIGFYHVVENDQQPLSLQAWSTRTVKEFCKAEGKGLHYPIDQAGVWVDCVHERKPVIHNDYSSLPHRKGMPKGHAAVIRELVAPIMRAGRIKAILGIGNKPSDYTEKDVEIVSYLADVAWEIAEHKRAEEALKSSEERYRAVFETASVGIDLVDEKGRFVEVNDALAQMLGYSKDELLNLTILDVTHPADIDASRDKHDMLVAGELDSYRFEKRYIRKDGQVLWADVSVSAILDPAKGYKATTGVILDITVRKRSEEIIRESEQRFRRFYEQSPSAYQSLDAEGNILEVNSAWLRELGYDREEVIGKWFGDFLAGDGPALFREFFEQFKARGQVHGVEFEMKRKDGDTITVSLAGRIGRDEKGEFLQTLFVFTNVTERVRGEAERKRLAAAIEQADETVVITDSEGVILYVNPAFEKVTGYTREEAIGQNPRILKSGRHDLMFYEQLWNTIKEGKVWSGSLINKKKDGRIYHEEATISPVKDEWGKITNFVAVKRDVTANLELSRQLVQAQKMEAIGTLAGGVAHDFNNLLTVMLGYSELLLADEDLPAQYRDDLTKINQSAKSGADLVQRLLMFSRKTEINPQPLNLNTRIEQLQKMLSRTIPKMIEIRLALADDLAAINADPTQVDQVLMNLAVNARDAMPEGGALTIQTQNITLDESYADSHLGAKPGRYVLLSVSDTGNGMDKETLQHIFEPFFTTKRPGEGTGLGLAMVYGIVKQHGGHIMCHSEPGRGTTFKMYFPAPASDEELRRDQMEAPAPGGSELILIVDDEKPIRELGSRIFTNAGYKVITASNGNEALDVYKARGGEIALVILDLIMPEMGGEQCLESLLSIDPSVKVVIASGYAARGKTKHAIESGAKGFVSKPYEIRQVLAVVRAVLDEETERQRPG